MKNLLCTSQIQSNLICYKFPFIIELGKHKFFKFSFLNNPIQIHIKSNDSLSMVII